MSPAGTGERWLSSRARRSGGGKVIHQRQQFSILVPQKALGRAKTRLRVALDAEARIGLTWRRLRRSLEVCSQVAEVDALIVNGPAELESLTREFGAVLFPGGIAGMRKDVTEVAGSPVLAPGHALLIVSSDLPLVNAPDLEQVIEAWRSGQKVVLVPDRHHRGTNVMMVDRPQVFPFAFGGAFGTGSFETHLTQAQGTDLSVAILELSALALDLDLPADLAVFVRQAPDDPLAQYCLAHARETFTLE